MSSNRWFFMFLVVIVVMMTIGITTVHVRRSAQVEDAVRRCFDIECFTMDCDVHFKRSVWCDRFFAKEVGKEPTE